MTRDRSALVVIALVVVGAAVAVVSWWSSGGDTADVALVGPLPTVAPVDDALPDAGPAATPEPTPAPESAQVQLALEAGGVVLTGRVPQAGLGEELRQAAETVFGAGALDDRLEVDERVLLDEGATITLTGSAPDVETASALLDAVDDLGFAVIDELQVAVPPAAGTVAALVADDSRLEEFAALVRRAELVELLEGDGPFTVLAPRDATLVNLDEAALDVLADPANLAAVVRRHVVAGTPDLASGSTVTTIDGDELEVVVADDGTVRVDGGVVLDDDLAGINGAVLVTNRLLLPPPLATQVRLNRLVADDPVEFAAGSAQLTDGSTAVLARIAAILADAPDLTVEIQGHTDADGSEEVNQELSDERAQAVLDYLVEQGIDADRLVAVGFGETDPEVAPEVTDADKAQNRRIEFRIL